MLIPLSSPYGSAKRDRAQFCQRRLVEHHASGYWHLGLNRQPLGILLGWERYGYRFKMAILSWTLIVL
jgi:hypothetical protein